MNDEEKIINIDLQDLENKYVVTKQFAGKKYFLRKGKRGGGYKCDSKYSGDAVIFNLKTDAQSIADNINQHKQKVKLKVEKASRYFCNKIVYDFSTYRWRNTSPLTIKNKYVPIEDVQKNLIGAKEKALAEKERFVNHFSKEYEKLKNNEQQLIRECDKEIEYYIQRKKEKLQARLDTMNKYKKALEEVEKIEYDDLVKQVETEQDKKFAVLFGELKL
jgi:exonuclease III